MGKLLLEIKDLAVNYETKMETVKAVNGLSLKVHEGETLGLVGETGAGKTTTAMSILRLLPDRTGKIRRGSIIFKGHDLLNESTNYMKKIRGNEISMIFQDPMTALNPIKKVGEQIEEVYYTHSGEMGKTEIKEKTNQILKLVGIAPERKNEYPHQFSGGMRQRVVIAMALACTPDLLIADEPTTALDVTIQAQVLKMMYDLKQKMNMAMILITHDLCVVAENCDSVAVMYAGEIVEYGSAEQVFANKYNHPYTKGLLNTIPDLNHKTSRLTPILGLMPDPTNLPKGCRFHPRCSQCMEICRREAPNDITKNGHMIKCHLFDDCKL